MGACSSPAGLRLLLQMREGSGWWAGVSPVLLPTVAGPLAPGPPRPAFAQWGPCCVPSCIGGARPSLEVSHLVAEQPQLSELEER